MRRPSIAAVLLPASGLAGESLDERVQQSYDTMRLGHRANGQPAALRGRSMASRRPRQQAVPPTLEPLKKTASLLVISTLGLAGRVADRDRLPAGGRAAGDHELAVPRDQRAVHRLGPRAWPGAALGLVGATVVTAIHLVAVESELAHLAAVGGGEASATVDPQALTTVVMFFALVAVVTTLAAMRMGSALRLPAAYVALPMPAAGDARHARRSRKPQRPPPSSRATASAASPARRAMPAPRRSPKC